MVIADFCHGSTVARTNAATQWDYGQKLRIQGLRLPAAVEVHFSSAGMAETITRIGVRSGDVTDVPVPDTLLEGSAAINAYIYITDETGGRTEYTVTVPVKARPRPEAHETPEQEEIWRETVIAVNEAADRAETARIGAKEAQGKAEGAQADAEAARDEAAKQAESAEKSATVARQLKEATETAAGAALENIRDEKNGALSAIGTETTKAVQEVKEAERDTLDAAERATNSASEAERYAELSQQGAGEHGYMYLEDGADGHLYLVTSQDNGIRMVDNNGRLEVVYE